ncbi:MAG TPA: hypothetical protein VEZ47_03895 [Gemmatirosa sp.]|nr:hypothetical protein [Gemmatirosa sp.]
MPALRVRPARRLALLLAVPAALTALTALTACASGTTTGRRMPEFLPPSRPAQFSFGGIPWGIRADSVTALVEPRGYNFNSPDGDGDLLYDGVLLRTPTRVLAFLTPEQRLVKFRVVMITPDEQALAVYRAARAELVKQYGAPREVVESAPAAGAEAKEEAKRNARALAAIKQGKARQEAHWLVGDGMRQSHVAIGITERLVVSVDYEGPAWDREKLRRHRARGASPRTQTATR